MIGPADDERRQQIDTALSGVSVSGDRLALEPAPRLDEVDLVVALDAEEVRLDPVSVWSDDGFESGNTSTWSGSCANTVYS